MVDWIVFKCRTTTTREVTTCQFTKYIQSESVYPYEICLYCFGLQTVSWSERERDSEREPLWSEFNSIDYWKTMRRKELTRTGSFHACYQNPRVCVDVWPESRRRRRRGVEFTQTSSTTAAAYPWYELSTVATSSAAVLSTQLLELSPLSKKSTTHRPTTNNSFPRTMKRHSAFFERTTGDNDEEAQRTERNFNNSTSFEAAAALSSSSLLSSCTNHKRPKQRSTSFPPPRQSSQLFESKAKYLSAESSKSSSKYLTLIVVTCGDTRRQMQREMTLRATTYPAFRQYLESYFGAQTHAQTLWYTRRTSNIRGSSASSSSIPIENEHQWTQVVQQHQDHAQVLSFRLKRRHANGIIKRQTPRDHSTLRKIKNWTDFPSLSTKTWNRTQDSLPIYIYMCRTLI